MQVKKQQLEPDMEQWIGSKLGKGYVKGVYCHPAYLTYMQSTCEMPGRLDEAQAGIKIAGRNINNLKYADMHNICSDICIRYAPPLWQKVKQSSSHIHT